MTELKLKFLSRFLKENGTTLRHFLKESVLTRGYLEEATKKCFIKFINTSLCNEEFANIIDKMLIWSETDESWDYWSQLNLKFTTEYNADFYLYASKKK